VDAWGVGCWLVCRWNGLGLLVRPQSKNTPIA
jgi:hypothetical protein